MSQVPICLFISILCLATGVYQEYVFYHWMNTKRTCSVRAWQTVCMNSVYMLMYLHICVSRVPVCVHVCVECSCHCTAFPAHLSWYSSPEFTSKAWSSQSCSWLRRFSKVPTHHLVNLWNASWNERNAVNVPGALMWSGSSIHQGWEIHCPQYFFFFSFCSTSIQTNIQRR